jgi:hypothetical protein
VWLGNFDPHRGAIYVDGLLHGPIKVRTVLLVLDTGAPTSYLDTAVADEVGYSARMGNRVTLIWGIGTPQQGYSLEVSCLEVMGLSFSPLEVFCHDIPPSFRIDGLIGLDLLARHILTLDFITGTIALGP